MASSTIPTEPITSDPVIINSQDVNIVAEPENIESRIQTTRTIAPNPTRSRSSSLSIRIREPRQPRARSRSRSRSRSPVLRRRYRSPPPPQPIEEPPHLSNTTALLAHLAKTPSSPDTLVGIQSGMNRYDNHMVYLITLPTPQAELEKISWIFKLGVEDGWVQKPVGCVGKDRWAWDLPGGVNGNAKRGRVDYYDDEPRYDRFDKACTPIVKLGTLFTTIFGDESEGEEKVKFVSVVQGNGNSGWTKLTLSYSRRGALVDIFHELINGFSIVFVGAVLKDVEIPIARNVGGRIRGAEENLFKKVGSIKEAEEVGEGVIGIIC